MKDLGDIQWYQTTYNVLNEKDSPVKIFALRLGGSALLVGDVEMGHEVERFVDMRGSSR
jgi:hypothetical protein